MRFVSLFSGIEAASLAWRPLGFTPVAYSEIDPFASTLLAERHPDTPNVGDITKTDWSGYAADVVVGGSPCQAFSIAGLRKALDDPRGQLMLEYFRACHEIDPEWIVWENVPGVLSAERGRVFQTLLETVAELWPDGGAAWRVLDAQFYGVAQRRRRVFLVVNTRDWRRAAPVLFERESLRWDYQSSRQARQAFSCADRPGAGTPRAGGLRMLSVADSQANAPIGDGLASTLTARAEKDRQYIITMSGGKPGGGKGPHVSDGLSPTLTTVQTGVLISESPPRRLTPVEYERLQGFPDGYTDVPWNGRPHAPDGRRYKALGNSMAVPVMKWIGEGIRRVENEMKGNTC